MNIVFAYHGGDCELALESAKAIVTHGINNRHKATVCCTEGTPLLSQITEELKKAFPEVGRIFAQDGFNGWPIGPNQMFSDASSHCYQYEDPWYFWEPDCVPMVEGWVDKLEEEFNEDKEKIMGSMVEGGVAPSGKNVYNLIVGSAIYPAKIIESCKIASNIYNYNIAYQNSPNAPEPWDVRCRWEFLSHGRNTNLIRAYWRSCKYQKVGNKFVFEAEDSEAEDIQSITCPEKTVDPSAVVVHGCKDGSLHRLIYRPNDVPEFIAPVQKQKVTTLESRVTLLPPLIGCAPEAVACASRNRDEDKEFLNKLAELAVKDKVKKKSKTTKKKKLCKK